MHRNEDYRADLLEELHGDPEYAAEYLSAAKADSTEAFFVALRDVVEARSSMKKLAEEAHLNRENLYRALSKQGNPRIVTLDSVLGALGFEIRFVPRRTGYAPVDLCPAAIEVGAQTSLSGRTLGGKFVQSSAEMYIAIPPASTAVLSAPVNVPDVPLSLVALEQKSQEPLPRLVGD